MIKKDYTLEELKAKSYFELREIARKKNVENVSYLSEDKLIESILGTNGLSVDAEPVEDVETEIEGYTREDFQNMTIHCVRSIVREAGITPSTKNKDQLIEAYLELMRAQRTAEKSSRKTCLPSRKEVVPQNRKCQVW